MLGRNLPLRETIQQRYIQKHIKSLTSQKLLCSVSSRNQLQKIERKQSYIYQPMKCSIFTDDDYNTIIYQWRKIQSAPIVRVLEIASMSGINTLTGFTYTHKTIKPQPIHCQLSSYNKFTKQQLLLILKQMLDGHQAIYKKLKATSVSLDKIFITLKGEVKVWINQHLQRNDISGEILNQEEDIVQKIFQTVGFLDQNNANVLNDLTDYVNSSIKKNGRWSFSHLRALTKSYTDCLKLKIPKSLKKNEKHLQQYIQYSLIQNPQNEIQTKKQYSLKKSKQQSIITDVDNNIKSSVYYTNNSRRKSQTNKYNSISLNSYNSSRTTTSKSINQQLQNILKFNQKYKHTSSLSKFNHNHNITKSNLLTSTQMSQLYHQHHNQTNANFNSLLFDKNRIIPLPEVQDQYCLTPVGKKTPREDTIIQKFMITSQFDMKIQTNNLDVQPSKNSTISTNKTSTTGCQLCVLKKLKCSHIDITMDDNKNRGELYRTIQKNRLTQKNISLINKQKKTITSCTNWSNNNLSNISKINHNLQSIKSNQILLTKQQEHQDSIRSFSKLQIDKQVLCYQNISDLSSKQQITSSQNLSRDLLSTCFKNRIKQLKSQQQIDQIQKTQKYLTQGDQSSILDNSSKQKILVQEKLLKLLNKNKKLVISTYMQTDSQKKIKLENQSRNDKKKKLKELKETLSFLMKANKKQEQIIQQNSWKKTLQTLLQLDKQNLKQSIGVEEANTLIRELKLQKLGKWGREIQKSLIPQ